MNEKTTEQTNIEAEESPLNWKAVFLISLFLGFLGIDRFYVGKNISGVLKLLTLGGFGIWWLVDLFIIACGQSTDASNRKIRNTTKRRTSALIFLAPIIMILIMSLMVSLFSSPEERERRTVEREQRTQTAETSVKSESDFTDPRDNKKYKIVKIGKQTWMAENLNYQTKGSKCYGEGGVFIIEGEGKNTNTLVAKLSDKEVRNNCVKYGRLYDWKMAMKACPKGWHLPDTTEWQTLVDLAGGEKIAGKKLKAKCGWNKNGNGTDSFGFSALPGGHSSDPSYAVGGAGNWWNASENNSGGAYYRYMYDSIDGTLLGNSDKSALQSVRCVQD